MINQTFRLVLLFSIYLPMPLTATAQIVDIPDPNLRDILESNLGKAPGATITVGDMAALTVLHASGSNIDDLTGLEHATNLRVLDLSDIPISDISPLAGITHLTELNLGENSISDISALAGLINLTQLWLEGNFISDISALAGLTQLTYLNLDGNDIPDISALAGLTQLTELWLGNNAISDISALAGLTNLTELWLWDNAISDISALAGLTNITLLSLEDNSISDISALAKLTNITGLSLEDNSVSDISALAGFTNLELLDLDRNAISDISPLAGLTQLPLLGLNNNPISDISALAELTNLIELWLGNNSISDLSPLVENTGLGSGDIVDVRGNPLNALSINTHIPALLSRGVTVVAYDIVVRPEDIAQTVDIPDPNLRAAIADTRGKSSEDTITVADILILVELNAINYNISDLTGLKAATNLTHLLLNDNNISDLSPITGLTQLTTLWLENNSISDLSPITGLTQLTTLWLERNSISDLSPLVANVGLDGGDQVNVLGNFLSDAAINTHIPALQSRGVIVEFDNIIVRPEDIAQTVDIPDPGLRDTIADARGKVASDTITVADMVVLTKLFSFSANISDLTGLEHATNLTELWLAYNSISDISTLARLTNLTQLYIHNNSISDISPLANLTNLTELWLEKNTISDISPLAGLTQLTYLDLGDNSISDISTLAGLTNLTELYLQSNSISDISPLVANTELGRGTSVNVSKNPLNYAAINTHIPTLQSRGVTVESTDIVAQPADINRDGRVNIFDLVSVASMLGNEGQNLAEDVNGDGIVNISDLVLVAGMFDAAAAAPSAQPQASKIFTAAAVQQWLTDAKALEITDPIMERGVVVLQQLLSIPNPNRDSAMLPNYPNPFNPETWIPYRLAKDAFVTLTIYDQTGQAVRAINVGLQAASAYESRSQAIYWDGRNQIGEKVASGVYFYHLSAGDYSATRKMLILK